MPPWNSPICFLTGQKGLLWLQPSASSIGYQQSRVHEGNNAKEGIHINLKGFAIGNGQSNTLVMHWVPELLSNLTTKASTRSIQHMKTCHRTLYDDFSSSPF